MDKKQRSEYFRTLGSTGGKATKKKYGADHYKKLGEKGQKALMKKLASL